MNILPKKRWHVRTRENIARVRRDEAKAAEEEKERERKIHQAEQEARLNALRRIASHNASESPTSVSQTGDQIQDEIQDRIASKTHINFFKDYEEGQVVGSQTNTDHQREAKEEKEKYEKQIGYLTYLGQDTNEALRKENWYNVHPTEMKNDNVKQSCDKVIIRDNMGNVKSSTAYNEIKDKYKQWQDPLNIIRKHTGESDDRKVIQKTVKATQERERYKSHKKKKKKHKHKKRRRESSSDDSDNESKRIKLDLLRKKRLEREKIEREREKKLISGVSANTSKNEDNSNNRPQKYNSQFNPHIARQNYSN